MIIYNEIVTQLERLDALDLSIFKDIVKKVSNDIQKVYYNSIKGEVPHPKGKASKEVGFAHFNY